MFKVFKTITGPEVETGNSWQIKKGDWKKVNDETNAKPISPFNVGTNQGSKLLMWFHIQPNKMVREVIMDKVKVFEF